MTDQDTIVEKKFEQSDLEKWTRIKNETKVILSKIQKKKNHSADVYRVNFGTKEWIKISGIEADFAEKGKIA